ncbi:MAG: UPF0236 family protein, partial [Atribacterota bacterium]|nr:UPF0236 family protein [Atribacterota bacterium]
MSTDMITITFPEVKVEIPVKDLTFDTLENLIFDIIQAIARKVFTKVLSDIDCCLRKNRRRGKLKNTGKRSKTFLTRFGDVSICRTRYLEKTGKARYLLDEALSTIKNQRISYHSGPSQRLKEKLVYLGIGRDFMHSFSLKAEEEMSLSQSVKH